MPQGELPRHIPEDIVEITDDTTVAESPLVNPLSSVDPYRAYRELERWLSPGLNMDSIPRPDQHGTSDTYDSLPIIPSLPDNWKDDAELIGTIIYTKVQDESGKTIDITERWEYPDTIHSKDPAPESDV